MTRAFYRNLLGTWLVVVGFVAVGQPAFLPNHGQWPAAVRMRAPVAPGLTLFLERDRLTWLRYDAAAFGAAAHRTRPNGGTAPRKPSVPAHAWAVDFVDADPAATPQPEGAPSAASFHYFLGADPAHWAPNLHTTPAARYANLWPGIDLKLHASAEGAFEYDLEVAPGADPARAALRYRGLKSVRLDSQTGRLHLLTALGELTEAAPVAWQPLDDDDGNAPPASARRVPVPCRFRLRETPDGAVVSFVVAPGAWDRGRPLVIDPVLVFATHSGASEPVWGHTATYDESGHLYAAGPSFGPGYPATLGAFDLSFNGDAGSYERPDVAISRYAPDGRRLLYATYLGGSGADWPHALLVNRRGELLVLGSTASADFPTRNAFQPRFGGGSMDLFIARFDSTGAQLRSATYAGGTADDGHPDESLRFFYGDTYRGDLAVDSLDRVYIASATASADFPYPSGTTLRPPPDARGAALVLRLAPDLNRLEWAAGLGRQAAAYGLLVPPGGAPYIVGTTFAAAFPTTPGTLAPEPGSAQQRDGFVVQLAPDGQSLRAATYLRAPPGVVGAEWPAQQAFFLQPTPGSRDVAVLSAATGFYPRSANTWGQDGGGLVMQRLTADLRTVRWQTTIGQRLTAGIDLSQGPITDNLAPTAFLVDRCGALYFSAWGNTRGLATTPNGVQRTTDGQDLYLAVLEPDATALRYATYLGGHSPTEFYEEHVDGGTSRFDPRGRVYQAVCTSAAPFPTTAGAWSSANQQLPGIYDEVAFKLDFEPRQVRAVAGATAAGGGPLTDLEAPATVQFTNQSSTAPGTTFQWNFGDGSPTSPAVAPGHTYSLPGTYTVTLIVRDSAACGGADTTRLIIIVRANDSTDYLTYTICRGDSVRFAAITAAPGSFRWSPADRLSNPFAPDPVASPLTTTTYAATGTQGSPARRNTWQVLVTVLQPDSVAFTAEPVCLPGGIEANLQLSSELRNVRWQFGDGTPDVADARTTGRTHFYAHQPPGRTYTTVVTGLDRHDCPIRREISLTTDALFIPNIITPGDGNGLNDTFYLNCLPPGTATLRIYSRWGQLVYDSGPNAYRNQWDAAGLPGGRYFYYLQLNYAPAAFKGWVEVIR